MQERAAIAHEDDVMKACTACSRSYLGHRTADNAGVCCTAGAPVPGLPGDERIAGVVDAQRVGRSNCASTAIGKRLQTCEKQQAEQHRRRDTRRNKPFTCRKEGH